MDLMQENESPFNEFHKFLGNDTFTILLLEISKHKVSVHFSPFNRLKLLSGSGTSHTTDPQSCQYPHIFN